MEREGALAGINVVEIGHFISAPYAAKLLGDLGADVIKIEPPGGDIARGYGPFRDDVPDREGSGLFTFLNTSKRGVTLDVTTHAGQRLLRRLVERADVVVENLDHDIMSEAGLSPDLLREWNPGAVVTSISTFGRTGPRAGWRGHGLQASAGSTVAARIGEPDRPPLKKPLNEEEFLGGVHGAAATLMAVLSAELTGEGQHVDISLQDILASVTSGGAVANTIYGTRGLAKRSGHRANAFYPWTVLKVADGFMEFCTVQRRQWDAFLDEAVGDAPWRKDSRYENLVTLTAQGHADALDADLLSSVGDKTRMELWEKARRARAPFHPVFRINELVNSDHLNVRGFFVESPDGNGDPVRMPGAPYHLWETPWAIQRPAPRLGEYNAEIFGDELGIESDELVRLARTGVI